MEHALIPLATVDLHKIWAGKNDLIHMRGQHTTNLNDHKASAPHSMYMYLGNIMAVSESLTLLLPWAGIPNN